MGGGAPAILGFEVEETVETSSGGNSHWGLALGPGGRLDGLEALFGALAQGGAEPAPEPRVVALTDLDDLLGRGFVERGRLLLDADATDTEDVGFVRRFLERHTGWELVLFGGDAGRSTARRLAALPRSSWLPWPPDLDQLRALARAARSPLRGPGRAAAAERGPPAPAAAAEGRPPEEGVGLDALLSGAPPARSRGVGARQARHSRAAAVLREASGEPAPAGPLRLLAAEPEPPESPESRGRAARARGPRGQERFDVDGVLEETLAVLALRRREGPRVRYRPASVESGALVRGDRGALGAALETLLTLARASGTEEDLVRLQTTREPSGAVEVRLEFPRGDLTLAPPEDGSPALFALERADLAWAELEPGRLTRAREIVEDQAGRLELEAEDDDTLVLACRLPAPDDGGVAAAEGTSGPRA